MSAEPKVVLAYLDDADQDLALAKVGIQIENRHAVFHIQQAAEKLVKAVRLHRGLRVTKEHRIAVEIAGGDRGDPIPDDDPWRDRLLPLDRLFEYATTYRYPTPSGRLKAPPAKAALETWLREVEALLARAREELISSRHGA